MIHYAFLGGTVWITKVGKEATVRVYSPLGNLVVETQANTIDLSDRSPGLYRVEIIVAGQRPVFHSLILASDK